MPDTRDLSDAKGASGICGLNLLRPSAPLGDHPIDPDLTSLGSRFLENFQSDDLKLPHSAPPRRLYISGSSLSGIFWLSPRV